MNYENEEKEDDPDAFTGDILDVHIQAAKRYGVEPVIHPKDFMYWATVHGLPPAEAHPRSAMNYFEGGSACAHRIASIIGEPAFRSRKTRLLEFASGYGRVSRHLNKYPHIELVCSDVHENATDFLHKSLGLKAFTSATHPDDFSHAEKYDVTFVLSLFTHLPKHTFGLWLSRLYETVTPGGRLIFTTHGQTHLPPGMEWPSDGFMFTEVSEQKDLDTGEYGSTITNPDYVFSEIRTSTGSSRISFEQMGYATQDLWIVHRT